MISFFREHPVQLEIQGVLTNLALAVGVAKPVDPLSGMIVNLVEVDRWFGDFSPSASPDLLEFLGETHRYFSERAELWQAKISRLQIRMENGACLHFDGKTFELEVSSWQTESGKRLLVHSFFAIQSAAEISKHQKLKPHKLLKKDPLTSLGHVLLV